MHVYSSICLNILCDTRREPRRRNYALSTSNHTTVRLKGKKMDLEIASDMSHSTKGEEFLSHA